MSGSMHELTVVMTGTAPTYNPLRQQSPERRNIRTLNFDYHGKTNRKVKNGIFMKNRLAMVSAWRQSLQELGRIQKITFEQKSLIFKQHRSRRWFSATLLICF
jgi:hypothetical protein